MKPGLPQELEKETIEAVKTIFLKYWRMKKSHLGRDRIHGRMYIGFLEGIDQAIKEGRKVNESLH